MSQASSLNGKTGEVVRWAFGMILAAVVAYFTAIGSISERVAVVETKENLHFEELKSSLAEIKAELRALRVPLQQQALTPATSERELRPRLVAPGRTID